ncbi:hypothetical protein KC19_3G200200 [Ceratodon purpureus]|uniref:Phytocyanin domain-containing protein n=1 Tax=Ceratodon purpureus TaxID=3225 RepID=A0A8T0IKI6_CERPU|nr:hypothetical protein KC19_3G200200 [Ceratodon purpureus]
MAGLKGRGSAGRVALVTILVAVGLLALAPGAYAATYNVGGSTQDWTYAGNGFTYDSNWVPLQTFHVGDVLNFKYSAAQHDVVEFATKAEYDACAGTTVTKWQTGNDLITLNSTGTKYYICSIPGHCQLGMKVAVPVVAASVAPGVAPASPPTTTPSPPGVVSPPPPPAVATPPGGAASSGPMVSMAGLLAAALVAGYAYLV